MKWDRCTMETSKCKVSMTKLLDKFYQSIWSNLWTDFCKYHRKKESKATNILGINTLTFNFLKFWHDCSILSPNLVTGQWRVIFCLFICSNFIYHAHPLSLKCVKHIPFHLLCVRSCLVISTIAEDVLKMFFPDFALNKTNMEIQKLNGSDFFSSYFNKYFSNLPQQTWFFLICRSLKNKNLGYIFVGVLE